MPKERDLTGCRFGKLVVLYKTDLPKKYNSHVWHCKCDCGGTIDAPANQLMAGYRKSCGCLGKPPLKDFVGKRFGDLTVVSYAGKKTGCHVWHCRCVCGNETDVRQSNLQIGHTTSCGCRCGVGNMPAEYGTKVCQIRKMTIPSNNRSGVRGVYWDKRTKKWLAQITFQGKKMHIGSYYTIEEAAAARKDAEEKNFGKFLEWYDSNDRLGK